LVAKSGSLALEGGPSGPFTPEEALAKLHDRLVCTGPCLPGTGRANRVGGAARSRPLAEDKLHT